MHNNLDTIVGNHINEQSLPTEGKANGHGNANPNLTDVFSLARVKAQDH